MYFQG
ncbi:1982e94d-46c7-40c7-8150-3623ed8c6050 [Thermothielavioides terrestris]